MNRIRLKYIVILISVALLVLVGLQLYQAVQLYEKKSEELSSHIDNILTKVAIRHEKASDLQRYTAFFGEDFSGQYKQALKQEFQNLVPVKESVSIIDTMVFEEGRNVKYLYITGESYDSLAHITAKHSVLARDISELPSLIKKKGESDVFLKDSNDLAFQLDKRVVSSLFKKSKYINEMMVYAFRNSGLLTPVQRIDLTLLDSIMRITLEDEGLETQFNYVITDDNVEVIEFPAYTDGYLLGMDLNRAESVKLFPGNIFDEELFLNVVFPNRKSILFHEIWFTIMISSLLIVMIVVSFYIMFKTILSQRRLAEIKNDFINNMTHEFKTPISTISLACQALNDKDIIQSDVNLASSFINMIDEENKRLESMVEQILKNTFIDKGHLKLRKEELDLNQITREIVDKARIRISKGAIDFESVIENPIVVGDPIHVNNMISNLIDNAIKYSKEIIEIKVKIESKKNKEYILTIEDRGIGIKNEHIDKIFDKLYRVPTGNVHNVKGYGLGLNYVRAIIDMHGWDIKVKSKYGEGTIFSIIIKTTDQ
ncbi:MAG: HAMP domain-containing sensor histidine kinase [Brumimicrobium sp.]